MLSALPRLDQGVPEMRFGAPIGQLEITEGDLHNYDGVIQLGVPPVRIDLLTRIEGVRFEEAWGSRDQIQLDAGRFP